MKESAPKPEEGEPKKSKEESRRDFLKRALKIGAGVVAGGVLAEGGRRLYEAGAAWDKEHHLVGEGIIVDKKTTKSESALRLGYDGKLHLAIPGTDLGYDGKLVMGGENDVYTITVKIGDLQIEKNVPKDFYESVNAGDSVACRYFVNGEQKQINSIKKNSDNKDNKKE